MKYVYSKTSMLDKPVMVYSLCTILLALMLWGLSGCGGARKGDIPSPRESLRQAMELYNNEKYLEAQDEFSVITLNYPGSVVVDSAEFYLGETHFQLKEYILASASYQRVVTQYPRSLLVPQAQFRIGECYYHLSPIYALDQEYTRKAIEELQRFLEDYPDDDMRSKAEEYLFSCRQKLAKKEYTSGILYVRIAAYTSAIIYLDEILNNYYDTKYAPLALFYKGEALQKDKRVSEALEVFRLFLTKHPDHYYRERVEERLKSLEIGESKEASEDG